MPANLPSTPESAPPNFYQQVGAMASGPGGGAGQAGAGQPGQPATPAPLDADHEFLDMVNKLLTVLAKMGQMQPRGQDITKFTQAAADAMKACVKSVFNQDVDAGTGQQPGQDGTAAGAAAAPATADMGTGAGAAAGMPPG